MSKMRRPVASNKIRVPGWRAFLHRTTMYCLRDVVIGGYAVAYHGYVRYTGDLDLFVELSVNNAAKLVAVLREFGFDLPQLKPALFLRKGRIVRLGCVDSGAVRS